MELHLLVYGLWRYQVKQVFMCLIEYTHIHFRNIWLLSSVYHVIVLFIIFVSSISIFIKVRFKPTPQHHGASNRERKLNCTLIWVTFSSMLFWLPFCFLAIFGYFFKVESFFFSSQSRQYLISTMFMSMGANSFINPVVYATLVYKIPEFRAGMIRIFHKALNHIRPTDLPVGNLKAILDP